MFAAAAVVVPLPAWFVERFYSSAFYLAWQSRITPVSNTVPFALFDVVLLAVIGAWIFAAAADIFRVRSIGWLGTTLRIVVRTITWSAVGYLFFLASWGLNYRRVALADRLHLDPQRVSTDSLRALATAAVERVNALYVPAHAAAWPDGADIGASLAAGFRAVERELGAARAAAVPHPKETWLNVYFRRAAVDGMTDPFFLESLIASDLLPFERPFVVAHEWAHLAGYANEGEANFVGWLACMRGGMAEQYSGWLFLYREAASTLPRSDRTKIADRLDAGPRADLRAVADRIARNISPRVAEAGWRAYNQYLKANRVEAGVASYAEVVRLILGSRFSPLR